METFKIGSLFDGSGGFPLAASLCGGTPVWASEIEPYPIAVTRSRFPQMKHIGNVQEVNGAEIEPVDVITFGSPCQDLSVAGKRAGLKHEANGDDETTRSGLFMEAVRIIKEMRKATNGRYPTFAIWENVPGAFSSNKGEDFRIVLEELIKIVEPTAKMPPADKNGWPYADAYVGDGWSLAYRTFDAQYWGVPQRRRRIHLVADFRGERAAKILFERKGLRGYFAEGRTPWKGTSTDAESCAGADDSAGSIGFHLLQDPISAKEKTPCIGTGGGCGQCSVGVCQQIVIDDQGGQQINVRTDGKCPTLRAETHGNLPCIMQAAGFKAGQGVKAHGIGWENEKCPTLASEAGGNSVPSVCVCYDARGNGDGDIVSTLTGDHENRITDYTAIVVEPIAMATQQGGAEITQNGICRHIKCYDISDRRRIATENDDICPTLISKMGTGRNNVPVICLQGNGIDRADTAGCNGKAGKRMFATLNTIDRPAVCYAMQGFGDYLDCGLCSGIKARDYKDATDLVVECAGVKCLTPWENQARRIYDPNGKFPALSAREKAGQNQQAICIRYIVRRLTPTECARLQGFADQWGIPNGKDSFTDDELAFWNNVDFTRRCVLGKLRQHSDGTWHIWSEDPGTKEMRDTGKPYKPMNHLQAVRWYSKLHTDSSEYKMWGNGIALPPALYVMQGIQDVMQ